MHDNKYDSFGRPYNLNGPSIRHETHHRPVVASNRFNWTPLKVTSFGHIYKQLVIFKKIYMKISVSIIFLLYGGVTVSKKLVTIFLLVNVGLLIIMVLYSNIVRNRTVKKTLACIGNRSIHHRWTFNDQQPFEILKIYYLKIPSPYIWKVWFKTL